MLYQYYYNGSQFILKEKNKPIAAADADDDNKDKDKEYGLNEIHTKLQPEPESKDMINIYILQQIRTKRDKKAVYEEFASTFKQSAGVVFIMVLHSCGIPWIKAHNRHVYFFHRPSKADIPFMSTFLWELNYLSNCDEKRNYDTLTYAAGHTFTPTGYKYLHQNLNGTTVDQSNITPLMKRYESIKDDTIISEMKAVAGAGTLDLDNISAYIKNFKRKRLILLLGDVARYIQTKKEIYKKFGITALKNIYISFFFPDSPRNAKLLHYASETYFQKTTSYQTGTRISLLAAKYKAYDKKEKNRENRFEPSDEFFKFVLFNSDA